LYFSCFSAAVAITDFAGGDNNGWLLAWKFPVRSSKRSDDGTDQDRIAGAAKETKGAIKETAGNVLSDAKLTTEGKTDRAEGKVQNAIGGLKDTLRK
jgi:uncharacterized protein YjbJ (UPF0337 family)